MCDEVKRELDRLGVNYQEVDISGDASLEAEFGHTIPVIEHRGRVVFEAGMDASKLRKLVRR